MIRIFFNPLDAKSKVEYPVEVGTRLIDFLQEHYPSGFDGVLRCFVGVDEIDLEDLDYQIQDADQVTMLVMPSGGITLAQVGYYALQALVAVAIGYVINLIFAPKVPGDPHSGEESVVYSLNATRQRARLGQPISVHYGQISYAPDFAAAPYTFFQNASNDHYADELLCLGNGYFTVDPSTMYIGDTPINSLEPGTVQYWLYGPDDHNSTMGVIEDDIWDKVKNTSNPHKFYENAFTSPEVDGYEFAGSSSESILTPTAISGDAYAAGVDGTGTFVLGHIEGVDSSLNITYGDTITLTGTTSNNITFVVGSAVVDPLVPAEMTLYEQWGSTSQLVDEIPLNAAAQFTLNDVDDNLTAGPYRAQKYGQVINAIEVDIVFPRGLYRIDGTGGNIKNAQVNIEVTIQEIDEDTGDAIGGPIILERTWISQERAPVRRTVFSGTLTAAAYEVTVKRVFSDPLNPGEDIDDARATTQTLWTGLRGYVDHGDQTAYGPVTLMAIRMKATNGLAQAARSRIRITATRVLDPNDSTIKSTNPITIIKDIWTNTNYGLGRPLADLDLAHIDPIEVDWDGSSGPKFNGSFDQRGTGYEGMQAVASMTGSKVVQDGSLTTVIQERIKPVRTALFTSGNIVRDSLEINYNFDTQGDYDGIEVQYNDPVSFDSKYAYYPLDPIPTTPDTYTLFGATDQTYSEEFAHYLWNVKDNRRKLIKFQVELEGLIPRFGDRIGVSHPMPDWGESGVVVEVIDPSTMRVDQELTWNAPGSNVVMLRYDDGTPDGPYDVSVGATDDIVIFDTPIAGTLYDQQGREPSMYAFGLASEVVMDFIISRISPKGDTIIEIEGQTYDPAIYIGAPPHMGETCAAYQSTIQGLSPDAYYPMTNGIAGTNGTVTSGGLVLDTIGSNDLEIVKDLQGGELNVNWTSLLPGSCSGATSYYLPDQTGTDIVRLIGGTDIVAISEGSFGGVVLGNTWNQVTMGGPNPGGQYILVGLENGIGPNIQVYGFTWTFDDQGVGYGNAVNFNILTPMADWPTLSTGARVYAVNWETTGTGLSAQTTLWLYDVVTNTMKGTQTVNGQMQSPGNTEVQGLVGIYVDSAMQDVWIRSSKLTDTEIQNLSNSISAQGE